MEEQEVEENPPVRPYKSLHSFVESPVRFINRTGREVHVIWINYEGKEVLKTTLLTNKKLDLNTFMTHPWIAVDAKTNERMLLNFRKTYLPGEPEVRRMDFEHRKAYVARAQVLITLPVFWVSSFYLSVNIVMLYQFMVTRIEKFKREVSRMEKSFKIAITSMFSGREDIPGKKGMDLGKQMSICKLEEYCVKTVKNIVSPQDICKLPLPPLILKKISWTSS